MSAPPTSAPTAVAALRTALLAAQHADGAWGMYAGRPAATEPTALALLALGSLREQPSADAVERARRWLRARQRADGGWPTTIQVDASDWASGPALLALAVTGAADAALARGIAWLSARSGVHLTWVDRLKARFALKDEENVTDLDASIAGWPWVGGTFSWVEPTSLAMLALRAARRAGVVADADAVAARLHDGERLLVDRAVPGGGWNYGNARVFDAALEPYPDTTAWALLALRGARGAEPVAAPGLDRLAAMLRENRSPLARALGVLAFRAHGRDDGGVRASLEAVCAGAPGADGPPPSDARSRSLALLSLAAPDALTFL